MKSFFALAALFAAAAADDYFAYCIVEEDPAKPSTGVKGLIKMKQEDDENLMLEAVVSGLNSDQKHGFHVHTNVIDLMDTETGCDLAGAHYNPDGNDHGANTNDRANRHVGCFPQLSADFVGFAELEYEELLAQIADDTDPTYIGNRSFVVHRDVDDLGLGTGDAEEGSKKGGNAGPKIGCCNIVMTDKATFKSLRFEDFADEPESDDSDSDDSESEESESESSDSEDSSSDGSESSDD